MNQFHAIADKLDKINEWVGRAVSWLTVLMVLNVFLVVVLRYTLSIGFVWMQELYVWMHAIVFLLGAGYTLLHDGHVRIDLIYASAGKTYKAIINILGSLFLGFPLIYLIFTKSVPLVERSWGILEKSSEVGGMPAIFLLKTVIPIFCILFAIQLLALVIRSLGDLTSNDPAESEPIKKEFGGAS